MTLHENKLKKLLATEFDGKHSLGLLLERTREKWHYMKTSWKNGPQQNLMESIIYMIILLRVKDGTDWMMQITCILEHLYNIGEQATT